ncbi:heat shock 70 kDa protein 12B-like [Mercenaria mercenaria]|uniref:heat shock 70 kDa protein 12B-like n=1 Tax=Mercenaria mercenaria TaxID=6596 RepID=UPI00234EF768|nr:heat shock 70 kDa protein 12B-like [Mercenaria mercenaria]XP_053387923.1 heat shock 70 kDa protein 12B-like [Mercenaria mercenaria]
MEKKLPMDSSNQGTQLEQDLRAESSDNLDKKTNEKNRSNILLIGAIDFGTTYSGWGCSFVNDLEINKTKAMVKLWQHEDSPATEKTPTCVLIRPDGETLEAFGYEAESRYRELTDEKINTHYFYFKRFKMALHKEVGEKIQRCSLLEDILGRQLPASKVFTLSIKFMVDDMLQYLGKTVAGQKLKATNIQWVLTVPAIWTEGAKQFMREAAVAAGIDDDKLCIALEPEAASIYCRYLSVETSVNSTELTLQRFREGKRYMVVDAGGGTVDINVHEVDKHGLIREICSPCGCCWGGTKVDTEFRIFLETIFGRTAYQEFAKDATADFLELWNDFDRKKRLVNPNKNTRIIMNFPSSLLLKLNAPLSKVIELSGYNGEVEFSNGKLKCSADVFKSFYREPILQITDQMIEIVKNKLDVNIILLVGGFAESPVLQYGIKSVFPGFDVVIPVGASSSILRGAIIYGFKQNLIAQRVLQYTYGVKIESPFVEGVHPPAKKFFRYYGARCKDIFDTHVEKGQIVETGKSMVLRTYYPAAAGQTAITFPVYASELQNPTFVDEGCSYAGELKIEFGDKGIELDRAIRVSLTFSGTEIHVSAEDMEDGAKYKARIDFLG